MKIYLLLIIVIMIIISGTAFLHNNNDTDDVSANYIPKQIIIQGKKDKIINIPEISQFPELPTGCEAVAATMVLQYYGVNITAKEFAKEWLTCSNEFYTSKKKYYGPDPNEVFVGNPFSESSYGCYAMPIINAINNNSSEYSAQKIENKSLKEICDEYIDADKPVLIWVTMGMKKPEKGRSWFLKNGTEFTWIAGEHCMVLVGYNDDYYFLQDPQCGSTVAYKKSIVESRFEEMYNDTRN